MINQGRKAAFVDMLMCTHANVRIRRGKVKVFTCRDCGKEWWE